jgi:endogenous inhibitor of DNA gyrase (YacG/DUF329 family)
MEDKDNIYIRCPNCGKYFVNDQDENNSICSQECKTYYKNCFACGNYFISTRNENKIYCSIQCGINPELQPTDSIVPLPHQQNLQLVDNQ